MKAGHPVPQVVHKQQNAMSYEKELPLEYRSLTDQNVTFISIFSSVLGTCSMLCLLFILLVLKSSGEELENQLHVLNGKY